MNLIQNALESLLNLIATQTANSTCWFSAYQEELPEEVTALKKYED